MFSFYLPFLSISVEVPIQNASAFFRNQMMESLTQYYLFVELQKTVFFYVITTVSSANIFASILVLQTKFLDSISVEDKANFRQKQERKIKTKICRQFVIQPEQFRNIH